VRFDLRLDESEPEMVNRYQRKVRAYRLTHTAYVAVCAAAKSQEVGGMKRHTKRDSRSRAAERPLLLAD
jgi:hypothetical protein